MNCKKPTDKNEGTYPGNDQGSQQYHEHHEGLLHKPHSLKPTHIPKLAGYHQSTSHKHKPFHHGYHLTRGSQNPQKRPGQSADYKPFKDHFQSSSYGQGPQSFSFGFHGEKPYSPDYSDVSNPGGFSLDERLFNLPEGLKELSWKKSSIALPHSEHPIAYAGGLKRENEAKKEEQEDKPPSIPDYIDFSSDDGVGYVFPASTTAPSITEATPSFDPYTPSFPTHITPQPESAAPHPTETLTTAVSLLSGDTESGGTRQKRQRKKERKRRRRRKILRKRKELGIGYKKREFPREGLDSVSSDSLEHGNKPDRGETEEDYFEENEESEANEEDQEDQVREEQATESSGESPYQDSYSVFKADKSFESESNSPSVNDPRFLKKRSALDIDILDYGYVTRNCNYMPVTECRKVRYSIGGTKA